MAGIYSKSPQIASHFLFAPHAHTEITPLPVLYRPLVGCHQHAGEKTRIVIRSCYQDGMVDPGSRRKKKTQNTTDIPNPYS